MQDNAEFSQKAHNVLYQVQIFQHSVYLSGLPLFKGGILRLYGRCYAEDQFISFSWVSALVASQITSFCEVFYFGHRREYQLIHPIFFQAWCQWPIRQKVTHCSNSLGNQCRLELLWLNKGSVSWREGQRLKVRGWWVGEIRWELQIAKGRKKCRSETEKQQKDKGMRKKIDAVRFAVFKI